MRKFMSDLTITRFILYTFFILKSTLNYKIPKNLHYVRKGERAFLKKEYGRFLKKAPQKLLLR